jgi:hypothetical protein
MIKHFNTALSSGTASGTSKKGGGMGTLVVIALIAAVAYFGYKFVVERNQPVSKSEEE